MKQEHYDFLDKKVKEVLAARPEAAADYKEAKLSHMRFRWDVLRATGMMKFVCEELYKYLNDDHIDSALRKMLGSDY